MTGVELYDVVANMIVEHHMTRDAVLEFTSNMVAMSAIGAEGVGMSIDQYLAIHRIFVVEAIAWMTEEGITGLQGGDKV